MALFKKNTGPIKQSAGDRVFNIVNAIVMTLITIAIVYPLYYVLLASITDPTVVNTASCCCTRRPPFSRDTSGLSTMPPCGPAIKTR